MRRADLEHIIRAAAVVAADEEIIVIGSQAIFLRALVEHHLVQRELLEERLHATELDDARRHFAANVAAEMFGRPRD